MPTPYLTSPLRTRWEALGARVVDVAEGWSLPAAFAGAQAEVEAARRGVALGDESARGKLLIQGSQAEAAVARALGAAPGAVGATAALGGAEVCRLRPDLLFLGAPPAQRAGLLEALTAAAAAASSLTTVTDVTHGRFELRLVGPAAPELLSQVCGLDLHPSAFPSGQGRQTSVAKTRQLVVRADLAALPAYRLIGGRALGAFVWDALMVAGRELGLVPIGAQALGILAE